MDADKHDWVQGALVSEATCTSPAIYQFTCSRNCGVEPENRPVGGVDADKHDWVQGALVSEATCTSPAIYQFTCSRNCGVEPVNKAVGDVDKDKHNWVEDSVTPATCASAEKHHYTCGNGCGKDKTETVGAPNPEAHNWVEDSVTPATCTSAEKHHYTCGNGCGKDKTEEVGSPVAHTLTKTEAVAATCSRNGNNAYWTCSVCGKVFSDEKGTTETTVADQTIPARHTLVKTDEKPANCGVDGNREYWTCSECGKVFSDAAGVNETTVADQTVRANGNHTLVTAERVEPTCVKDGQISYVWCMVCSKMFNNENELKEITAEEKTLPATGVHTLTAVERVDPTVEKEGMEAYWQCSVCGKLFSDAGGKTEIAAPVVIPRLTTHTVTWKSGETVLELDENVVIGTAPSYAGEVPAKAQDADNLYTFASWAYEPALNDNGGITGDTVATAQFTAIPKVIAGFDFAGAAGTLTYKPALADLQAIIGLPATVKATLTDAARTQVDVGLVWNYAAYDALPGDGDYLFTAALADATYTCAEGVALPTYALHIGPATAKNGSCAYRLSPTGELTIEKWYYVPEADSTTGQVAVAVLSPLDGYPVVAVGPSAFQGLATMTRLELPAGVRTLGAAAFADCPALTTLVLPDSLEMEELPENLTLNDTALVNMVLRTDLASTLTAANKVERDVPVEGQEKPDHKVLKLPLAVTDMIVSSNTFTLGSDFTVAVGHSVVVNAGATLNVAAGATLIDLGNVTNNGTINYSGTITNCAGTWAGEIPVPQEGGVFHGDHQYASGKCVVCGAEDPNQVIELTATYIGAGLDKVYDKNRNVTLKGSDLQLNGIQSGHDVKISGLEAEYDKVDAGDRTVTIKITLGGNDAKKYTIKSFTVPAKITQKELTITPKESDPTMKKTYGAKDPTQFSANVSPIPITGDKATGRLERESGEKVGKYKILIGTISLGPNYKLKLVDGYFTIEAKSINSSDIGLVTIGNQRYTGQPITPDVTLRFGSKTLVKDTDFKVTYTDNTQPGTAKVKLVGIGNYTGERETTFKILNVASDNGSSSSGSSGGSSYGYKGFDDGEGESDEDLEEEEIDPNTGKLFLKDEITGEEVDYGTILYRANGKPAPFVQFVEKVVPTQPEGEFEPDAAAGEPEPDKWTLTIIPDPLEDKETGETLYLDEANEREKFDELHLRLSQSLLKTLTAKGFTEIVYQLDGAEVRIPIESLKPEIPLTPVEPEVDDDELELVQEVDEALAEGDEAEIETIKVAIYDLCMEQVENLELTERETDQMKLYKPVTTGYRLRVGVITESEAALLADAADAPTVDDATTLTLSAADELPANRYPEGLRLLLTPLDEALEDGEDDAADSADAAAADDEDEADEDETDEEEADEEEDEVLASAPKDAVTLYMSYYPAEDQAGAPNPQAQSIQATLATGGDPAAVIRDVMEVNPTTFVNEEGMLYAEVLPTADGIYAVGIPKTAEELALEAAQEAEKGDEGDFEDLGGASTGFVGTSFGMGTSFSVDENGKAVFN